MSIVRHPAVAGMFYPGRVRELSAMVRSMLHDAAPAQEDLNPPKSIIAPHAGYIYSGAIAASAYAHLTPLSKTVRRVVLIGPSHRVPLRGLAVPTAEMFATPLGTVRVDRDAVQDILSLPQVQALDRAHEHEHSLEVHLPFLQELFDDFAIVPLVAGHASDDAVAEVLERLWGGDETIFVISSDLSHYHEYETAKALDENTCRAIERLDTHGLDGERACGFVPVCGLLTIAKRRQLAVTTLDLRNSGDTAGDRKRVVGYGAWMFTEQATSGATSHRAAD